MDNRPWDNLPGCEVIDYQKAHFDKHHTQHVLLSVICALLFFGWFLVTDEFIYNFDLNTYVDFNSLFSRFPCNLVWIVVGMFLLMCSVYLLSKCCEKTPEQYVLKFDENISIDTVLTISTHYTLEHTPQKDIWIAIPKV